MIDISGLAFAYSPFPLPASVDAAEAITSGSASAAFCGGASAAGSKPPGLPTSSTGALTGYSVLASSAGVVAGTVSGFFLFFLPILEYFRVNSFLL
tara:strand:- start:97 stop:384 length:288 start_codon:yes stop_codon:yes gene_type:complete